MEENKWTEEALDDLQKRLNRIWIATCTCLTKTPDVEFHSDTCTYKGIIQADDAITELRKRLKTEV